MRELDTKQWTRDTDVTHTQAAYNLVSWIRFHRGVAEYMPQETVREYGLERMWNDAYIRVLNVNGWRVANIGDYIVMTDLEFVNALTGSPTICRNFFVRTVL